MSADTLEIVESDQKLQVTEDGDHDTFSHYARVKDIEKAIFEGVPLTALCGKKWLPSKDHTKYPVCQTCKDIYESLPEE